MGYYVYTNIQTREIIGLATEQDDVESLDLLLESKHILRQKHRSGLCTFGRVIRYSDESIAAIRHKAQTIPGHLSEVSKTCYMTSHRFDHSLKSYVEYSCPSITGESQKRWLLNLAVQSRAYKAVQFWLNEGARIDDAGTGSYYRLIPDTLTLVNADDKRMQNILTGLHHPIALKPSHNEPAVNHLTFRKKIILLAIRTYDYEALINLLKLKNIDEILISFGKDILEREDMPCLNIRDLGLAYLLSEAVKHYAEAIVSFLLRKGADPNLPFTLLRKKENTALKLAKSLEHNSLLIHIMEETKKLKSNEQDAVALSATKPSFVHHRFSAFTPFKSRDFGKVLENISTNNHALRKD